MMPQTDTLRLGWRRNIKLEPSLLKVSLRVYPTLHLSDLGLFLYFGMHLSLSPSLCRSLLNSPNPGAIGGLLKLHPPQGLLIISVINGKGLEVYLSTQINPDILENSSKESVVGEYSGRALIA